MKLAFDDQQGLVRLALIFEGEVWSKTTLPCIAATSNYIREIGKGSGIKGVLFDFTDTYWVEVPTLLALATLANQIAGSADVKVQFGAGLLGSPIHSQNQSRGHERKRKFLSFLRSMGFFSALPAKAVIVVEDAAEGTATSKTYSTVEFENIVGDISAQPFIQAVTLIPLRVLNTSDFSNEVVSDVLNERKLKELLRDIGENAALNISAAGFNKGTIRRQRILLSVDKILQESLANIIEHAYKDMEGGGHFAFYARVRNPNSTFDQEFRKGLYETSDEYDHSKDINWTELYVCDLGIGLESQIEPWLNAEEQKKDKNEKLISDLRNALKASNKFLFASRLLFDNSLSRHANRDHSRSPQTGLQDLRRVLSDVGYVDITNCLFVNRRRFNTKNQTEQPSSREKYQEARTPHLIKDEQKHNIISQFPKDYKSLALVSGTHLIYRTQFGSELPSYRPPNYKSIGGKLAASILSQYRAGATSGHDVVGIDKRFSPLSKPTEDDYAKLLANINGQKNGTHLTLLVRLSRSPYKNDVNEWLKIQDHFLFGKDVKKLVNQKSITIGLYFVDVLPVYAGWLIERIKSFSNTRWMLDSGFSNVGVLTNILHFAVFEKSNSGYKLTNNSTSSHAQVITNAMLSLREMDSLAFWRDYDNHLIREVYIDEEIEWISSKRKLGDVFQNESKPIWGFLDFATSLQSLERFRVCERALLRFMAIIYNLNEDQPRPGGSREKLFIPKLKSSDSMTHRLAGSVNSLFSEIARIDDASLLVLSSIVMTGQTQERVTQGAIIPDQKQQEIRVSFFDRSENRPESELTYSLMNWSPPGGRHPNSEHKQKRIFRTPEVSPRGALDIRIPHVIKRRGVNVENYQRDRAETYADFELLGALELGHFKKSNRHELINLNLNALVPLIIATSHKAWNWLVSEFYNQTTDADKSIIIVYPNQPHAEQIIQEVRHREAANIPPDRVSFISAPFLMSRKTEPIIVSPRLELRLADLVRELAVNRRDATENAPASVVVRIFDAGVVSGRTLRALKQQIESVFETHEDLWQSKAYRVDFETISLVDRSGHPIYGSLLSKYSKQNKRFWRWDVPSLTDNGTCRICLAQDRLRDYSTRNGLFKSLQYAEEVVPSYSGFQSEHGAAPTHGNESLNGWRDDLADIRVPRLPDEFQKVIFGYFDLEPNEVFLSTPLQYISTFLELTRLLHRSDIALNRAMELAKIRNITDGNIDCLVILLLSSHILLFYEAFDRFELLNYAVELFGCLVDFDEEVESASVRVLANTLGMLALYAVDLDALEVLKGPQYFCQWLSLKRIRNPRIRAYIHHVSAGDAAFPVLAKMGDKETEIWKANLLLLRKSPADVVSKIMDIVGDQRVWHTSPISKLLAGSGVTHKSIQPDLEKLVALINEAHELRFFTCSQDVLGALTRHAAVAEDSPLNSLEKAELLDLLHRDKGGFRRQLFGQLIYLGPPDGQSPSWSGHRAVKGLLKLFLGAQDGAYGDFLPQLNAALKNKSNREKVSDLFAYLGVSSVAEGLPFVECVSLVPSVNVRTVVEHVLLNSRHATRPIADPLAVHQHNLEMKYAWVWLSRQEDALVLNLANRSEKNPNCERLYRDRFPDFIAEGNSVDVEFDAKRRILYTRIKFKELVRR